jgi:hypothetical protein
MPPNRIVALLTPVVAVAAGGAATWLAEMGLDVDAEELQAVFIAVVAAVLAPAGQWLYGSQKFERHQEELERKALEADTEAAARDSDAYYEDGYDDDLYGEDEDLEVAYAAVLAEDEPPASNGG